MSGRPEQLERLDTIFSAAGLAHETIFELRRALLGRGLEAEEATDLLAESARIATSELPLLLGPLRSLSSRWEEEALLAPDLAGATAAEIATGLAAIESQVIRLLDRQSAIAARLGLLLEG